MRRSQWVAIVVVAALLLGAAVGWFYRRWTNPRIEERAHDVARELQDSVEKRTR